jgi:hypothetical protein
MATRTKTRQHSRKLHKASSNPRPHPDSKLLLEVATQWHTAVRGMIEGIVDSAVAIADAVDDSQHPLADHFDVRYLNELIDCLRDSSNAMTNLAPHVPCPIGLPDPLAIC